MVDHAVQKRSFSLVLVFSSVARATSIAQQTREPAAEDPVSPALNHGEPSQRTLTTDEGLSILVQLSRPAAIPSTKHVELHRWPLTHRADDTWEVVLPSEMLYVPSDIVVPLLAHQLAART